MRRRRRKRVVKTRENEMRERENETVLLKIISKYKPSTTAK